MYYYKSVKKVMSNPPCYYALIRKIKNGDKISVFNGL